MFSCLGPQPMSHEMLETYTGTLVSLIREDIPAEHRAALISVLSYLVNNKDEIIGLEKLFLERKVKLEARLAKESQ